MLIVEIVLLTYFTYITGYTLFFGVCANVGNDSWGRMKSKSRKKARFCVLIPAYKEDAVIVHSAKKALNQTYPAEMYDVVVVADSLQSETMSKLEKLPLATISVSFKNSTKVKSLNAAMSQIGDGYDYAVVLDADNVMKRNFLEITNRLFQDSKYKAIQGQRKPKNQQQTISYLDAVSESINTSVFRRGTSNAGLSSSISGSGFAVDYLLLKEEMAAMNSVGGFDKELEILLLMKGIKVKYVHDLVVYDEKVSSTGHFENQRKRWISSQYHYLAKYFRQGVSALLKVDLALFNSTILRNLQLPRLINLGLFTLLVVAAVLLRNFLVVPYYAWVVLFGLNALAILISIPREFYSVRLIYSIAQLPMLFVKMVSAFLQIKSANKKFIHTPHEV